MIKICGFNDDLLEIEGSTYKPDEIDCFDEDVRIHFTDGTIIRCGYSKPKMAVWYIIVERVGAASQNLTICDDENADPYSDIFEIDAEIERHSIISKEAR